MSVFKIQQKHIKIQLSEATAPPTGAVPPPSSWMLGDDAGGGVHMQPGRARTGKVQRSYCWGSTCAAADRYLQHYKKRLKRVCRPEVRVCSHMRWASGWIWPLKSLVLCFKLKTKLHRPVRHPSVVQNMTRKEVEQAKPDIFLPSTCRRVHFWCAFILQTSQRNHS